MVVLTKEDRDLLNKIDDDYDLDQKQSILFEVFVENLNVIQRKYVLKNLEIN